VDEKIKGALDAVNISQAGIVLAIAALAEALIKERILDADRLIAHLEKPSEVLTRAGAGDAGAMALNGVISYLKLTRAAQDQPTTRSH
jgi:hypothetical protein